jgi:hypothetical protein
MAFEIISHRARCNPIYYRTVGLARPRDRVAHAGGALAGPLVRPSAEECGRVQRRPKPLAPHGRTIH